MNVVDDIKYLGYILKLNFINKKDLIKERQILYEQFNCITI